MGKKKLKIALDIDGVICDLNSEFTRRLKDKYRLDLPDEPDDYNYKYESFPQLENEDLFEFMDNEFKKGMLAQCEPYPESYIFVTNLIYEGWHDVYFVTARGSSLGWCKDSYTTDRVRKDTANWLKEWFPQFPKEKLIYCDRKHETCQKLGIDIIVEDKFQTAENCADVTKSLLLTRGWNNHHKDMKCTRINSIAEVGFFL